MFWIWRHGGGLVEDASVAVLVEDGAAVTPDPGADPIQVRALGLHAGAAVGVAGGAARKAAQGGDEGVPGPVLLLFEPVRQDDAEALEEALVVDVGEAGRVPGEAVGGAVPAEVLDDTRV